MKAGAMKAKNNMSKLKAETEIYSAKCEAAKK
jgi:hypothetical protein